MIFTKILDGINNLTQTIETATKSLKSHEPIAFPTETVYGIGALFFDEDSIKKIFYLKERSLNNPLSAHIGNLDDIKILCDDIPDELYILADNFLPGPLSIIMKKSKYVQDYITGKRDTINIRMPKNSIFEQLIKTLGQPLAATSANKSGYPSANNAHSVYEDFKDKINYIIDGGVCQYSIESTIISLVENEPILIRPGVITQNEIEKVLNRKIKSQSKNISIYNPASIYSTINNSSVLIKTTHSIEKLEMYLKSNYSKKILLLLSEKEIDKIEHKEKIRLSSSTFFETIRYSEKNNFDEIIVLFDNFVNNIDVIKHRLRNSEELE